MVAIYLHFINKFLSGRSIKVYSEPSQTCRMEHFVKILDNFKPLTILAKSPTLDVCQTFECVYGSILIRANIRKQIKQIVM